MAGHMPNDPSTGNESVDLREFDQAFDDTPAASSADVPDGRYQVRIQSATLRRSGSWRRAAGPRGTPPASASAPR